MLQINDGKTISNAAIPDPKPFYRFRRSRMGELLKQEGIGSIIFIDTEGSRSPAIRYFTGHPSDAALGINDEGLCVLIPWDENLAAKTADADFICPYTEFGRDPVVAAAGVQDLLKVKQGKKVEIPPETGYLRFLDMVEKLHGYHVLCRKNGLHAKFEQMRAVKDEYETACIRRAAHITDEIIELLEQQIRSGVVRTELDAALCIERECRLRGCEKTGFDSLIAGSQRSFGIHCFPAYTAAEFPGNGLAVLDFGVVYEGYASDVTLTFAGGKLSKSQEKQIKLMEKAYSAALKLYAPDIPIAEAALAADVVFSDAGCSMPHSLGHGIGLEVHEYPVIKASAPREEIFRPGMIVTLEPGLYSLKTGGCRHENDILITQAGNEALTHSRVIML